MMSRGLLITNLLKTMNWKDILDWVGTIVTVGSFIYASVKKERFNDSVQYNLINILGGITFATVGVLSGLYGLMFRQLFFTMVSIWNFSGMYREKVKERNLPVVKE